MSDTGNYVVTVYMPLNGVDTFRFSKNKRQPYGYILAWKFASGTELKADFKVPDPENPSSDKEVVAVLDGQITWPGGPADPIELSGRLSSSNKAKLNTCVNSLDGGADVEISFVVVDYDPVGKAFFDTFSTGGSAVKLAITPGTKIRVNPIQNTDVTEPANYSFSGSFTAKGDAGKQQLSYAADIGAKTQKQLGGLA
jgi:hypothetical protein